MKVLARIVLLSFLMPVTACSTDYTRSPRSLPLQGALDGKPVPAQLCQSHARVLFLAEDSVIHWQAVKNEVTPVVGTQKLSGYLASDASDKMQKLALHLDFDISSVASNDELRDTRIMNYVLGLAENMPMTFDLTQSTGEGAAFPAVGAAVATDFTGKLAMTGKEATITVKASVSKGTSGYVLSTGSTPLSLNLDTDLGLSTEVARLMSLVEGVTLNNTITLTFDLVFREGCS